MASGARQGQPVRIGLVQMCCQKGAVAGNLARVDDSLREGRSRGAEILCFPEMSITGYIDPARYPRAVLGLDGPEVARFVALTGTHRLTALAGLVETNPGGKPFITQVVASDGKLLGSYRKRTIPPDEAGRFAPGGPTATVFTHGEIIFGVAICADIDSPAVFAASAARGARLVFEAAAPGLYGPQEGRDWQAGFGWWRGECIAKLGRYARENGIYIAVATQAGRTVDEDFPGGGYLFAPNGACLAATPDWSASALYATVPALDHDPAHAAVSLVRGR